MYNTHPISALCDNSRSVAGKKSSDAYVYLGIDVDKLQPQTLVDKNMFSAESKPNSVTEVMSAIYDSRATFLDLYLFVKLVTTFPMSSTGAKRSFSVCEGLST